MYQLPKQKKKKKKCMYIVISVCFIFYPIKLFIYNLKYFLKISKYFDIDDWAQSWLISSYAKLI